VLWKAALRLSREVVVSVRVLRARPAEWRRVVMLWGGG